MIVNIVLKTKAPIIEKQKRHGEKKNERKKKWENGNIFIMNK